MHFAEFVKVIVGSLYNLDLSDLDVLNRVDGRDLLGDLLLNDLRGEEVQDLGCVGFGDLLGNDVVDSLSDDLLLGREGVVGLALLVGGLAGEGDDEDAEDIPVLGLDVLNGLDEGLSLLDEGAELIASDVDSVEAGNGLPALGLVDDQLDLPPVEAVLVGGEVCLHGADDSSLDAVLNFL